MGVLLAEDKKGSETPLDADVLAELRRLEGDGAKGLFARVVDAFLSSSDELARALHDALAAGDAAELAAASHTLKSSSAQMGALRLSSLCKDLESLGRGGTLDGAQEGVDAILAELEPVKEALAVERFGARSEP